MSRYLGQGYKHKDENIVHLGRAAAQRMRQVLAFSVANTLDMRPKYDGFRGLVYLTRQNRTIYSKRGAYYTVS